MKKKTKGLTFIELVVVVVILSVIALTIYATLSNGLRIWSRINKPVIEENLNIVFEKFTQDLRNCLMFQDIDFLGTSEKIEFASLVGSSQLEKKTVGQVTYYYQPYERRLARELKDFSQVYNDSGGKVDGLLDNVKSLQFEYYYYDTLKNQYLWHEESLTKVIPLAIRMKLEITDNGQTKKFSKTVGIPAGG